MFWDMAVVLKPTQEAPAASTPGSSSLPGTPAKSELLDTHGNMACLGEVNSLMQNLTVEVSQNLFRGCWCGLLAWATESTEVLKVSGRAGQRNTERCLCICHRKWLVLHTVSRHHTRQTQVNSKFSFFKNNFTYLFLALLGLLAAKAVASLLQITDSREHRLWELYSCDAQV